MRSFSAARLPVAVLAVIGTTFAFVPSTFALPTPQAHGKVTVVASAKPVPTVKFAFDPADPSVLNPQEAEFIDRINHERTSRGLNALTVDPLLVQVARGHSEEMCRLNYFDHHSPTQGIVTPMERYLKTLHDSNLSTPAYLLVGENIYYCSILNDRYNVEFGHQSLMNSPGHRANILEPRFARIGVGTYRSAKGEIWVTETFVRDTDPQTASAN